MKPPEDPWDAWRKRHTGDFPAFFAEFEKEFARMQGMIDKIMQDAMRHAASPQRGEPFVYGFSMRVGPDGVPRLQPFGSTLAQGPFNPAQGQVGVVPEGREPLSDLQESEKEIAVTVELPGAEKEDVNLHVTEELVTVRVEKGKRYAARIRLPAPVEPSSAKATFKNGILDLALRKKASSDPGHRVAIS